MINIDTQEITDAVYKAGYTWSDMLDSISIEPASRVLDIADIYPVALFARRDRSWRIVVSDGRRVTDRGTEYYVEYIDKRGKVIQTAGRSFVKWCRRKVKS